MATDRTMSTTWHGTLMDGSGTIHEAGSGAFGPLQVSWASRAEAPNGKTSPEELIAAAHSACFSMALAHGLAQAGTPADQLDTSATVTFVPGEGITKIALTVRGIRAGDRRGCIRRGGRGCEGRLPGLEGARGRSGDHARRSARLAGARLQPLLTETLNGFRRGSSDEPRHQIPLGLVDVRRLDVRSSASRQVARARPRPVPGDARARPGSRTPSCRSRGCGRTRRARAAPPAPRSRAC